MTDTPATAAQDLDVNAGRPRLNRRQAAKVRTRQKVLDAARALFAERGYDPATIRDIAKGAGMSTGAVFANFQDKAELFEAVLADDMARMTETLKAGAGEDVSGAVRGRLVDALSAGYRVSIDQIPLVQAVIARSWFQPVEAERRARDVTKGMVLVVGDILQDAARGGQIRADADLRLIGELVWDAYLSNYRRAAYDNWTLEDMKARLERQVDAILAGFLNRQ